MRHIGLFEGIGGFSLAAEWMGWETVAWCEWVKENQIVLKYYFPNAEGFGDITKSDFTKYANTIDILTGGFPCQPFSVAGERKGANDERYLWPEMLRAIREVQPRWVVGENVSGLLNWNKGVVFHEVQTSLEAEGFEVFPPTILPASGIGADHDRQRVWIVAYSRENDRRFSFQSENNGKQDKRNGEKEIGSKYWFEPQLASDCVAIIEKWANRPIATELYDGLPAGLDIETFFKIANNGYGNAIVPQLALQIFQSIEDAELETNVWRGQKQIQRGKS